MKLIRMYLIICFKYKRYFVLTCEYNYCNILLTIDMFYFGGVRYE